MTVAENRETLWNKLLHGLGLLISAALVAVLWVGVYEPLGGKAAALDRQLTRSWRVLGNAEKIGRSHREATAALGRTEQQIRRTREQIPETSREAEFLAQIRRLADNVRLTLVDYQPGREGPYEFCQQIKVTVRGRGSYESICRFLAGIDELPRLCRVTQLTINSDENGDQHPVELTLAIYFAARPEAFEKPNSPLKN